MDYAAARFPEPQPPPPQHHHLPLPQHHPYPVPPPQAHHLTLRQSPPPPHPSYPSYYTNPSYPNPSYHSPIHAPAPVPVPLPVDPYAPHGGYSVGPAAGGAAACGGLAGYYYERVAAQLRGFEVKEAIRQYGVDLLGYPTVPPMPSNGQEPAAPAYVVARQPRTEPYNRRGVKKATKVVQSAYCGVCKIDCTTQEVLSSHKQGKKHKKNLQKLQEAITPRPQKTQAKTKPADNKAVPVADKGDTGSSKQRKRKEAQSADLETKKKRVLEGGAEPNQVMVCSICNVVVNSQTVYDSHITGSKHAAMAKKQQEAATPVADNGDAGCSKSRKRKEAQDADLETKMKRILGGGADPNQVMICTICSVVVNNRTVYDSHITGSKHAAVVKKLREAAVPVADKGDSGCSKQRKWKEAHGADLETKKMRILEGGADPNQVMVCTICNVIVNSQTVYDSHINGSKHAAMVKKQQEAAAPVGGKGDAGSSKQRKRKEAPGADLETKKKRILEGGADPNQVMVCTICNVVVNTRTVYDSHITGSKHAAMAKKQQEAAAPVADKGDAGCSKNRKRKEAQGADLETKMKRILGGGADPNQVMMCTICTVVVNNQTAYNSHITGSKHAAMVKKQQEAAAPVAEKGDAGSIKQKKGKEA